MCKSIRSLFGLSMWVTILAIASAVGSAQCAQNGSVNGNSPPGGGSGGSLGDGGTVPAGQCVSCVTSNDCGGMGTCAQFQGDTFCATACPNEDECPSSTTCMVESAFDGTQVSVCVPNDSACGMAPAQPSSDAGLSAPGCTPTMPNTCGTYVPPDTPAGCHSCGSSSSSCQTNGCYGGWWCDTSNDKCHAQPANCGGSASGSCDGGASSADSGHIVVDAGGPVTGTIGANGGTVSRLLFTVVGDTRPANEDDTGGYPTDVVDQIYSDIAALNPKPPFSLSTGDYQFASPSGSQSAPQLELYMAARAKYSGAFFPAMGNHECTGATASNCGSGNTNGTTSNYSNFLSLLLGPIQQTKPYYSIDINAIDGSWTSKFVFVAANAWDSTQSSWLSGVMAKATTYTFVVRHESSGTSGPPGVSPSDSIIKSNPYTLLIVGHTHTYEHPSTKEVIFGNGGAPVTGSGNYGYGLLSQRSDGAITVDDIDYQSGQADASFHFVLTPTGALTQ